MSIEPKKEISECENDCYSNLELKNDSLEKHVVRMNMKRTCEIEKGV